MGEGDPESAEAVTIEHVEVMTWHGPVIRPVYVPLLPEESGQRGGNVPAGSFPGNDKCVVPEILDIETVIDTSHPKTNKV